MRRIVLTRESKAKPWEIAYICLNPLHSYSIAQSILEQEKLLGAKIMVGTIDECDYEQKKFDKIEIAKLKSSRSGSDSASKNSQGKKEDDRYYD